MFRAVETSGDSGHDHVGDINLSVEKAGSKSWVITNEYNLLNRRYTNKNRHQIFWIILCIRLWNENIEAAVLEFQNSTVDFIQRGYDGSTVNDRWTFPNALMFTLSVITTIG